MKKAGKFDLGIRAGYLVAMAGGKATVQEDQFVGVKNGAIASVEKFKPAHKKASRKFIEAQNQALLPGLLNGHTHLPMTLFRGVAEDVSFHDWLFERILPLEAKLVSKPFVRDGIELAILECLRFGVTTVNEMYFFAGEEADALDKSGLRAIVAQCMASVPLPEDKVLGTDKFSLVEQLRKKYAKNPRITIGYGPHAPYTCDNLLLEAVAKAAEQTGAPVHIHLSETEKEVKDSFEQFGISPVVRLQQLGLLRKGTSCAHCVHLNEKDRDVFQASGASVIHNPDSNAKLGSGVAPVVDYLKRGIPLSLGTDGSASNNDLSLFGAMDIGCKIQKLTHKDSSVFTAEEALNAATLGGAKALGLGELVGSVEVGKRADLVLVDLNFPHLQPVHDLVCQLVFSAQGCEVATTIVEGKVLFHQGKFTTLDPKKIYKKAAVWQKKIAKTLSERK
jgi:5-methylthioadenosine/S-adenosylhomocysteine deaminase